MAQENPRHLVRSMSSIRKDLKGKDMEDRMVKRAKLVSTPNPTLRFQGQTTLEAMAVSLATALDYARRAAVFQSYCKILHLPDRTATQV
jgi:hypothetical protein